MTLGRGIFFDRDGVLNQADVVDGKPFPPKDANALIIVQDAEKTLYLLQKCGYALLCVTNQPDAARGTQTLENILEMNEKVKSFLPLDDLLVCLHDRNDFCSCRKPKPGMLLEGAAKWGLDLSKSWMIGDRAGDVAAGQAAGCRTVFIDFNYNEPKPDPAADFTVGSLFEAAKIILKEDLQKEKNDNPNYQEPIY